MSERPKYTPTESLATTLSVLNNWQKRVFEPDELSPMRRAARVGEEIHELDIALLGNEREEILDESLDVVIGSFGIALTVAEPQEVAARMLDKLTTILRKYDSSAIKALKAQGMTTDGAMEVRKTLWIRSQEGQHGTP